MKALEVAYRLAVVVLLVIIAVAVWRLAGSMMGGSIHVITN
jgi:hypothetical protein